MKPTLYFLVITTFTSVHSFAQENNQSVIAPAGDISQAGNIVLEWTVGEPIVETVSSSNSVYTQGFHQSEIEVKRINYAANAVSNSMLHVFPNPTASVLNIRLDHIPKEPLLITLIDASGRVLLNNDFPLQNTTLKMDVKRLSAGTYFLRISNKNGSTQSEYKVIKAQ